MISTTLPSLTSMFKLDSVTSTDNTTEWTYEDNSSNTFSYVSSTYKTKTTPIELSILKFVNSKISYYGYFFINTVGILTNLLVIATVISSNKLRRTSSGLLIIVLAHADLLTRASGTAVFAMYYNKQINIRPYCLIVEYIWNAMKFYSHWIMVLISVNRYALVCHPFTHKSLTSMKSTVCHLAVSLSLCALGALYIVFGMNTGRNDCYINSKDNVWIYVISTIVIYFILSTIVPLVVTTILTIFVFRAFRKNADSLGNASTDCQKKLERQVTKALQASNIAFLMLNFPYSTVYVPYVLGGKYLTFPVLVSYNLYTAVIITNMIESLNFIINLFLYNWYSPIFRQALIFVLTCGCKKNRSSSDGNLNSNTLTTRM